MNSLTVYLTLALVLFLLGLLAMLTRKNAISILMGIELILNSAGINFVAFSKYTANNLDGHVAAVFIIIVAAAEAAVALAIFLNLYRLKATTEVDQANLLEG
jgi:NAD(P)H-quinone oxidoreductase subunit 4L